MQGITFQQSVRAALALIAMMGTMLGLNLTLAQAKLEPPVESRSLTIWNRPVEYRLLIQENSALKFDGEAFVKTHEGRRVNYVSLNRAFLKKEAEDLFLRFEKTGESMTGFPIPAKNQLMTLERELMISQGHVLSVGAKNSLRALQLHFEALAWNPVYRDALQGAASRQAALNRFTEKFIQIRSRAIEYHEASHLIDIAEAVETESQAFEKYTELNAFYTELAYGDNPYDVLSQGLVGLRDEMNRGGSVDYSLEKVLAILRFLRECPLYAKAFRGPMAKCCLEILARLQRRDLILAGETLYRENTGHFRLALVSMR